MKEFDDVKAIKEFVGWELGDLDGQVLLIKSGKDQGLHVHGWYKDANDNIVMRNKILLKSQYTIYRNWLHLLHEYAENPDYFTFLGVNLRLVDLDDHDMLADGLIMFENQDRSTCGVTVYFNQNVHRILDQATRGKVWKWESESREREFQRRLDHV